VILDDEPTVEERLRDCLEKKSMAVETLSDGRGLER
jgi:DNA-binding response OmpR family regulator